MPATRLTIVVADDMPASRADLSRAVRQLGHVVREAEGGKQALQLIEDVRPDLVLLDLLMPDLTGFQVAEAVRERVTDRWLPMIVLSSMEGQGHFVEALSRGADDYLVRPVSLPLLEAKLAHYCRVLALQSSARASSTRLKAMHQAIPDALVTVDSCGQVVETNPAADTLFGPLTGRQIPQPLQESSEAELDTLAGPKRFAVRAGSWATDGGTFTTFVLHDLTERVQVELMKDEFLATVSHELRTPMTSMIGAMDLIAGGFAGELPAEAAELVTVAHENGRRLASLIDDVLDLTKLQASGPSLRLHRLCLAPILAQAARANQGYASRAGVLLDYEAGPPEAAAQVDTERLMQVLANLLSNAVKHSPQGARVRLTLEDAGEHWAISVSDRGPGISPEFRPRLFERFAQADSSDRRRVAGTGLGLYITRMLVQRMKGEISVNSEAGKGATFTVHLPKA